MQELFVDPVMAADGFMYERKAIEGWLLRKNISPMTNEPLEHTTLMPNRAAKATVQRLKERQASGLLL